MMDSAESQEVAVKHEPEVEEGCEASADENNDDWLPYVMKDGNKINTNEKPVEYILSDDINPEDRVVSEEDNDSVASGNTDWEMVKRDRRPEQSCESVDSNSIDGEGMKSNITSIENGTSTNKTQSFHELSRWLFKKSEVQTIDDARRKKRLTNKARPKRKDRQRERVVHQCEICEKTFTQKSNLTLHIKTHSGERPFQCYVCTKKFKAKAHLSSHILTHTGEKPFKCDVCGRGFARKHPLARHMVTHNMREKRHQCEFCYKKFTEKSDLAQHMPTHTKVKAFQCTLCAKRFVRKQHLTYHMRIHTNEKPYECDLCDKRFATRPHLNYHVRTHGKDKPYQCLVCEERFTVRSNLIRHTENHAKEKPHECEECHKKFSSKADLVRHIRTHTKEKPYQCEICKRGFTRRTSLTRHSQMHTDKKQLPCAVYDEKYGNVSILSEQLRALAEDQPGSQCQGSSHG